MCITTLVSVALVTETRAPHMLCRLRLQPPALNFLTGMPRQYSCISLRMRKKEYMTGRERGEDREEIY